MTELQILRKSGSKAIVVPDNITKLQVNEPVSDLVNLGEVIRALPTLETLILYVTDYGKTDFTKSLDFLRDAKQLKSLSLRSMPHLEDCGALAGCRSLESLGLSRYVTEAFDFNVLPTIASLKSLYVEVPTNQILTEISKTSQLTSLEARGGFKLDTLEPLATLVNIQSLKLWSGSLKSTRGLVAFQKLEQLNLGYSKLQDTSDLGSVKKVNKMELLGNKAIANLDFLRGGDLEYLGLFEIPTLRSLKPVSRLRYLKELCCEAKIVDGDLLPLASHPALKKVIISGRYKSQLKKHKVDSECVFKVGNETLKLTKAGPLVLETASEANERLRKRLEG